MRLSARAAGAALFVFALLPLHRLLDPARTGPAGSATRASAEAAWTVSLWGTLIVVLAAAVLAWGTRSSIVGRLFTEVGDALARVPTPLFPWLAGSLALALSVGVALGVHGGLPTSVDEMAQLLHAQVLADGALALSSALPAQFWAVQNGLVTEAGWASVYPPMHTLVLAGGLFVGMPWLVGPLALGVATGLCAASFERLLDDVRVARAAALLLAVTPFWLLLGATHLSHATAAAAAALVLWTGLRARASGPAWMLAVGGAVGVFVTVRPWTGIVLSLAILLGLGLVPGREATRRIRWLRGAALVVGGAPFAALLFWWNATLFGSPLTLGYSAAFGPAHGLGFHVDPWGNRYGLLEAVAYSGADLVQLSAHLFESPLSPLLLIAVAGLLGRVVSGAGTLMAWAFAGVLANALYWHHGVHMGPRMLFETVPAWVALTVLAGVALVKDPPRIARFGAAWTWALLLGALGAAWLAPLTVAERAAAGPAPQTIVIPAAPATPAVVFVHGSWSSRIAARLAAAGMRRDSIETALRRNDVCRVDAYARARLHDREAVTLDFDPQPGTAPGLAHRELSPGNAIRVDPASAPTPTCLRAARADRFGSLELEPLLWRAPPLSDRALWLARDMGPLENAELIRATGRTPYLWVEGPDGGVLHDYGQGMELLWGGAAGEPVG